ncbi:MAG TPA: carbon monoxide dehydrogenase subunit G [Terriglobales bacterium]|jgi:carbon monoxide dehydrogenase subunit G|nr:carbon monoxide dehydrogenase subunit G [Terriglobales bacterium]
MKLEGSYTIAAPLDAVWSKLLDPAVLQRAIPGCQSLEEKAPHQYRAVLKAGVGPVKGTFHGDITLTDIVPEKSYTLTSNSKSTAGFVEGVGRVELEGNGDATTIVRFTGEAKVGGMLASVGGRLVEAAAQKNIRDTFDNLARELNSATPSARPA